MDHTLIYPELSYEIVGVCMKVHRELGPEMLEKYYQRALEEEFRLKQIPFEREMSVEIRYGEKSIGRYFLDFVIDRKIVLETKAQPRYSRAYFKQLLAYLRQLDVPLGLVVNFRSPSIKAERVINSRWRGFDNSNKLDKN